MSSNILDRLDETIRVRGGIQLHIGYYPNNEKKWVATIAELKGTSDKISYIKSNNLSNLYSKIENYLDGKYLSKEWEEYADDMKNGRWI